MTPRITDFSDINVLMDMLSIFSHILNFLVSKGMEIGTFLLGSTAVSTFFFLLLRGRSWYESAQMNIAERTLTLHQQEHQRKFKFDIAVEAIDIFSKLQVDFDLIRSPISFEGEIKSLKSLDEINDFVRAMKKHQDAGVIIMRFDERAETAAAANRLRAKFKAVFADDTPFEVAVTIRHKIWVAARMLTLDDLSVEIIQKHHAVIWKADDDDEISKEMAEAVQKIEELCIPVVRGQIETLQPK